MDIKLTMIVVLMVVSVVLLSFIMLSYISEAKKYEARKKRLDQLNFKSERDVSIEEAIDKITKFVDVYILKIKPSEKDKELELKLRMIGWDKYFGYKEWRCFVIFMACVGGVFFLVASIISPAYGAMVGGMCAVMPSLFLHNESNDVKLKILDKLPDIIIITEGYLSAGYTLPKAIEETIPFSGKTWMPILKKLVADMELMGIDYALNNLKNATNVPEVREFASLVKIAYSQGDVGESFVTQAERMEVIQEDINMQKIASRRSLAAVANAPVILAVFLLVGAPAVSKVLEMSAA